MKVAAPLQMVLFYVPPCLFSKSCKLNTECPSFNMKFLYLTFWNESCYSMTKKSTMPTPLLFSETDLCLRKEQYFHLCWKPAQAKCHLWKLSLLGNCLHSCFVIHCFSPMCNFFKSLQNTLAYLSSSVMVYIPLFGHWCQINLFLFFLNFSHQNVQISPQSKSSQTLKFSIQQTWSIMLHTLLSIYSF